MKVVTRESHFEAYFSFSLRRIVVLFNENEREIGPK